MTQVTRAPAQVDREGVGWSDRTQSLRTRARWWTGHAIPHPALRQDVIWAPCERPESMTAAGVSPVTPDHVNPEAPWPHLEQLAHASAEAGLTLTERLAVYPEYALAASRWLDPAITPRVLAEIDATGFVREDPWV